MSDNEQQYVDTDRLAQLLVQAADESTTETLEAFYRTLLSTPLLVPERAQDKPLGNQPSYPNEFLNILGVQKKDLVFVPFFSSHERILEWSGHELRTRQMTLGEIIELLPAGWWLIMNPGSEGEKDFSSWELDLLRGGEASIPAIIDEILVEDVIDDVGFSPLEDHELTDLKTALKELAEAEPDIEKLFLIRERGKTVSEREVSSVILGVLITGTDPARREELQEKFGNLGALTLIGAEKMKVRVGNSLEGNLMLGIFEGQAPLFERRRSSWLGRMIKR